MLIKLSSLRILIFLVLTLSSYRVFAQFGLKGGFTFTNAIAFNSKLFTVYNHEDEYVPSYMLGGYYKSKLNNRFSASTELLFSDRGNLGNTTVKYDSPYQRNHLYYLSVAEIFYLTPKKRFSFLAGPELAFLLRENSDQVGLYFKQDDQNIIDVGIDFGIAYQFSYRFSMDFRYYFGLVDVIKKSVIIEDQYGHTYSNFKIYNRVLQLNANITIGKKIVE